MNTYSSMIRVYLIYLVPSLFLFHCARAATGPTCGDGICHPSENFESCPEDCVEAGCGNGQIELGEECDGSNLDGQTCATLGFDSGSLACTYFCEFDTTQCQASCTNRCAGEGLTRCAGNFIETCRTISNGCLDWVQTTDCTASSMICDDSQSAAQCASTCTDACQLNEKRCQLSILQGCLQGENGCAQWKDLQNCSQSNLVCTETGTDAACTDPCTHECVAGAPSECSGNMVKTCQTNELGCRVWVDGTNCQTLGQVCSAGACICLHECDTSDTRCLNTIRQNCTTQTNGCRVWNTVEDCSTLGKVCDTSSGSAQCALSCTDVCASGAVRCNGNMLQNCQIVSSGCRDWVDNINCAASGRICSNNTCTCNHSCSSGNTQCNGDMAQTCVQDAYGCWHWANSNDCAAIS